MNLIEKCFKSTEKAQITFRFPSILVKMLEKNAKKKNLTKTKYVELMLIEHFDYLHSVESEIEVLAAEAKAEEVKTQEPDQPKITLKK